MCADPQPVCPVPSEYSSCSVRQVNVWRPDGVGRANFAACRRATPSLTSGGLHQRLRQHISRDIREPEVTSLKFICQPGVVDAQAAQNGGLQIVDVDGVFDNVVTKIVGL